MMLMSIHIFPDHNSHSPSYKNNGTNLKQNSKPTVHLIPYIKEKLENIEDFIQMMVIIKYNTTTK